MEITGKYPNHSRPVRCAGLQQRTRSGAFTVLELLVVIAIISILAGILLPALHRAKGRGQATIGLSNLRQLGLALQLYAADNEDRLPYNMGKAGTRQTVAAQQYRNWVNNVMNWELDPDNTNTLLLTIGGIGPYCEGVAKIFKSPADDVLSDAQRQAGWPERVRSVSMNAMLGDAGEFLDGSINTNNPAYQQFFQLSAVPTPSQIFAFVEEHPDSINDGYFINRFNSGEWTDLPASYYNNGANFSFADGHAEFRQWRFSSTTPPSRPDAAKLPRWLQPSERGDLNWVLYRTSVYNTNDTVLSPSSSR